MNIPLPILSSKYIVNEWAGSIWNEQWVAKLARRQVQIEMMLVKQNGEHLHNMKLKEYHIEVNNSENV